MTHAEIIKAAEDRAEVIYDNPGIGTMKYRRISAIYWRYAKKSDIDKGMPDKFMQVELEDFSGTSITVAKPERIRLI